LRPRHAARAHRAFWRNWTLWIYFPLAVLLVAGWVFLWRSGHWLVHQDDFGRSTWAAVLAGEFRETERADAALKLYLDGRIDSLVYSGVPMFRTRHSSEFLVDYLAKQGYPREKLFEFRHDSHSTQEEARLMVRQFRQRDLDTVVLITVNYHTARTRRIFRKLSQGYPHILVHPADYHHFDPASWWSSREGRKYWLLEWTKTVSTWIELMGAAPETGKAETSGLIGALGLPPSSDAPSQAFLDSIAAASEERRPDRLADSLAAVGADSADSALSAPRDTGRSAASDTAREAGAEAGEKEGPAPEAKPAAGSLAAREGAARPREAAAPRSSSKDTVTTKAPVRQPAKAQARKASEKEKEKAKKKPSR
jgi:uncharacterized SAM-binding protein YcdF (DUF218 family)